MDNQVECKLIYTFISEVSQCSELPKVTLPQGVLEGFHKQSVEGNIIYAFEGVPYAEPPVGHLRFKDPQPAKPWQGIWKANTMFTCMQLYHYTPPGQDMVIGDEDCLYMNIYTPDLNPTESMDVLVYIHGGAFMFNKGGNQGPEFIVGFLSTEDDLILGLFQKGYSQSGCALNGWALVENPLKKALKLANLAGCPTDIVEETVNCLRSRPAKQIVAAVKQFQPWLYNPFTVFGPVVDIWTTDPFIPDHPFALLEEKKVQDLPWMISYVSEEGLYPGSDFYDDEKLQYLEDNWNDLMPYILHYMDVIETEERELIGQKIRKQYLGDKKLNKITYNRLIQAMTDRLFVADIEKAGKLHSAAVSSPVYSYFFNYRGAHSKTETRINSNENIGVSHTDDNAYMFKTNIVETMSTEADRNMTEIMVQILVGFVKNGKPGLNTDWKPLHKNVDEPWRQLRITNPRELILEEEQRIGNRAFWDSLGFQENENVSCLCHNEALKVTLPQGVLEGYIRSTNEGTQFIAFEGIPFAEPPTGQNRFEEPKPPKPWIGVWQANTLFECIQYDHKMRDGQYIVTGDEDCLYVNVYTPDINPTEKYDVLVYIHGGAFIFGNGGMYVPNIIMDRPIVYVNFNYRVGPLGNLGLRDQQMALKWIKENIHHFGGNPNSVTIMGTSAGGASVELHYVMPKSKGLFNRGISQSGCTLNSWVLVENPLGKTKKIAEAVGCSTSSSKKMVECLKSKPARQITFAVGKLQPWLFNPYTPVGPVVDKWASDPVLSDHPYILLKTGKVQDLPWMISFTSDEGLYPGAEFYNDEVLEHLDKNWNELMPHVLHYADVLDPRQFTAVGNMIRKEYLGNEKLSKKTFKKLIQAMGDRLFVADIEKSARIHSAAVNKYFTSFDNILGVAHGDDTLYILPALDIITNEADRRMSRILIDMVISFMKTGKPSSIKNWQPLAKDTRTPLNQLKISNPDDVKMVQVESIGNSEFWNSLPFRENEKYLCIQYDHITQAGQDRVSAETYDVLVYIHGGAFMCGSGGLYVPNFIMNRPIVYVNFNYRLGPLGFLSTEDDVLPGNLGLKDQQMALKWIKENIHHFGGNPDSITIMGTSAGGASVELHYVMPKSKGLFNRGISQSGCTLNSWVLVEKPLEKTKKIAESVGCSTSSSKKMVECLKSKHARQITYAVGKLQDLPWMISFTADEGLYPGADFYNDEILRYLDKNWNDLMPHILHYADVVNPGDLQTVGEMIRKEYLGNGKLNRKTFKKMIQSPVYHYNFAYEGSLSVSLAFTNSTDYLGVSHGDDVMYILPAIDLVTNEKDRRMSRILIDMVISFMKNGSLNQLKISGPDDIKMVQVESIGNSEFWNSLPFRENEKDLSYTKDEL
nr:unnamed protein product [Callosobruchus analis]